VRPSELTQVLRAANPWWSRRQRVAWVPDDPELSQRERHEWAPATRLARTTLSEIGAPLTPGIATVLVGPRGVGKTTAAKDTVLRVLSDLTVDARAVVWVPVEAGRDDPDRPPLDPGDLENVLHRPTRVGAPACDGPRLIVIDEASASEGWVDVVAAGAAGAQLLVTASVAGKAVDGLPARNPGRLAVRHLRPATLAELIVAQPTADAETVREDFISHGGLPRALAEHRDLGRVSPEFLDLLAEAMRRDLCPGIGDRCRMDDVLVSLCSTTGRFIEPALFAAAMGMSPEHAEQLLDRLADAGVIDPRRGIVDPLLHHLPALRDPSRPAPTPEHVASFSL